MKTFKNTAWEKRNYDCTNIVACQSEAAPNDTYAEADESLLVGLRQLWMQNGVRYYGYL